MSTGDFMDPAIMAAMLKSMDVLYHFAGIADIDECKVNPVDTARVNILGTVQLLEACRQARIQRFVFASSAYVYSDAGFFYRSSKQTCESFIENYAELYGLKYTCLRYGSLYGPRADARNSIYRLIHQAVGQGKISYQGTGEELREFILDKSFCCIVAVRKTLHIFIVFRTDMGLKTIRWDSAEFCVPTKISLHIVAGRRTHIDLARFDHYVF